jgi:hypothetical protein
MNWGDDKWVLSYIKTTDLGEIVEYNNDGTVSKCTNSKLGHRFSIDGVKYDVPCNLSGSYIYNGVADTGCFQLKVNFAKGNIESASLYLQKGTYCSDMHSVRFTLNSTESLVSSVDGTNTVVNDSAFSIDDVKSYIAKAPVAKKCN